ncbi:MAG: helix-turn-helix transcriptional regulator [Marinibacterium sp.]
MTRFWRPGRADRFRARWLAAIIILQTICAAFFVGDVVGDLRVGGVVTDAHNLLESLAAAALVAGVVALMLQLRQLLGRMRSLRAGLNLAQGRFSEVLMAFFDEWNLTDAEREVALLILKGLDNKTIAQVRKTAEGTVRAQATRVYAKSGSDGRAQFVSLFVEELMSEDPKAANSAAAA